MNLLIVKKNKILFYSILFIFSCKSNQICFSLKYGIICSNDLVSISSLYISDCDRNIYRLCIKENGVAFNSINYYNIDTINYTLLHGWKKKVISLDSLYKPNCQYKK